MSKLWDKLSAQWQDAASFVLAVWLILSPWVLGYAGETAAAWNAWAVGVIVAVAAGAALVAFSKWEEWAKVALAVWLVVSPWLLGFGMLTVAVWNQIVVGLLVMALALWAVYAEQEPKQVATKG